MAFRLLSKNSIVLIEEMLSNQDLLKLIHYGDMFPLDNPDIEHTGSLVEDKIYTSPFAGEVPKVECVNVRVFFPSGRLRRRVHLGSKVAFQIVIHKGLWHIRNSDNKKCIRPYEIMAELVEQFEDKSIGTLGVIHFSNYYYNHINSSWGVYTLEAEMTTI